MSKFYKSRITYKIFKKIFKMYFSIGKKLHFSYMFSKVRIAVRLL